MPAELGESAGETVGGPQRVAVVIAEDVLSPSQGVLAQPACLLEAA